MKITLGPSTTTKGAFSLNTFIFENKEEESKFYEALTKSNINYTIEQKKSCCLESDITCTNCGSCRR